METLLIEMDIRSHVGSVPLQVPTVSNWSSSAHVSVSAAPSKLNPALHVNVATVPISKGEVMSVAYDTWPFVGAVRAGHSIAAKKERIYTPCF